MKKVFKKSSVKYKTKSLNFKRFFIIFFTSIGLMVILISIGNVHGAGWASICGDYFSSYYHCEVDKNGDICTTHICNSGNCYPCISNADCCLSTEGRFPSCSEPLATSHQSDCYMYCNNPADCPGGYAIDPVCDTRIKKCVACLQDKDCCAFNFCGPAFFNQRCIHKDPVTPPWNSVYYSSGWYNENLDNYCSICIPGKTPPEKVKCHLGAGWAVYSECNPPQYYDVFCNCPEVNLSIYDGNPCTGYEPAYTWSILPDTHVYHVPAQWYHGTCSNGYCERPRLSPSSTFSTSSFSIFMPRDYNNFSFEGIGYVVTPHINLSQNATVTMNYSYYNYTNTSAYIFEDQGSVLKQCNNTSIINSISQNIDSSGGLINITDEINISIPPGAVDQSINFTIIKYNLSNCFIYINNYNGTNISINKTDKCLGVTCTPTNPCKLSACNPNTGNCEEANQLDGTDCNLPSNLNTISPFRSFLNSIFKFLRLNGLVTQNQAPQFGICQNGQCIKNNKLITYYPFDGNATDLTGNGNSGSCYQSGYGIVCNSFVTGKVGQAYNFNGANYIKSSVNLKIPNSFTIGAWVKQSNLPSTYAGLIELNNGSNLRQGLMFGPNGGIVFEYDGKSFVVTNNNITDSNWHYIVGVWDSVTPSIYVDGVSWNYGAPLSGAPAGLSGVIIGSDLWINAFKFNGTIDEIKIWNYALNSTDVFMEFLNGNMCNTSADCGTKTWVGNPICQGNYVYQNMTSYSCESYICMSYTDMQLKQSCTMDQTCSNGVCISTIPSGKIPIAYYPLEGNANDMSGNGNNMGCQGSFCPTFNPNGKLNGDYNFNGNQYLTSVKSNTITVNKPFTLMAWVNPNSYTDSYHSAVSMGSQGVYTCAWIGVVNAVTAGTPNSLGGGLSFYNLGTGFNQTGWHHLAETFDGTNLYFYVDGKIIYSMYAGGTNLGTGNPMLGSLCGYTGFNWNGGIDEVKIWNYSLNSTEVYNEYTRMV